jgi:hypothetical protein
MTASKILIRSTVLNAHVSSQNLVACVDNFGRHLLPLKERHISRSASISSGLGQSISISTRNREDIARMTSTSNTKALSCSIVSASESGHEKSLEVDSTSSPILVRFSSVQQRYDVLAVLSI